MSEAPATTSEPTPEPQVWNQDNEHTLDLIRLNSVNLSERHFDKYQKLKKRVNGIKVPFAVMSVANIFLVAGLPQYVEQKYANGASVTLSVLMLFILLVDRCLNTQHKLETELMKHVQYQTIGKQIYDVLSIERIQRNLDPQIFLDLHYKAYDKLTETSDWIQRFKDVVISKTDRFMTSPIVKTTDPVVQKLHDHWNILFQPKTFKNINVNYLKSLQEKDLEKQDQSSDENSEELPDLYPKPFHMNFFKNPFAKAEVAGEDAEESKEVEMAKPEEPASPTSPETKKKFGMTFMAK